MISRNYLKCTTCKTKIITRTAIGHSDYQEFAFPCPKCGIEIRFGMDLDQKKVTFKYSKIINATWIPPEDNISNVEVFDAENLNPVQKNKHFSPFMATALLPKNLKLYGNHRTIREMAIKSIWPQIEQLFIHIQRRQWHLFDKVFKELGYERPLNNEDRLKGFFNALENYSKFFRYIDEAPCQRIKQRIALAESSCPSEVNKLIDYFKQKAKDEEINTQLYTLRKQWTEIYPILAPVYLCFYWDDSKNKLTYYTLAQKRFDDLKNFYVDCFETFCRISVLAAGIETIIFLNQAAVMKSKGVLTIEEFDSMNNGSKPDILKNLVVSDLFTPYMNHKLRNAIGHNSAKYDVTQDIIQYFAEKSVRRKVALPYILFCEEIIKLYGQLELISLYSNWLSLACIDIR